MLRLHGVSDPGPPGQLNRDNAKMTVEWLTDSGTEKIQVPIPGARRQDLNMSTDVSGMIECRPGARLWGPDDEDSVWQVAIDLFLLNRGNAYDGLACLFGTRNTFGFRPVAEGRGFPHDASEGLVSEFAAYGGPADVFGTTWLTWAEVASVDWTETDSSGTRSRGMVAGDESDWGRVWSVMRTLSEVHGAQNVRLVVWFH